MTESVSAAARLAHLLPRPLLVRPDDGVWAVPDTAALDVRVGSGSAAGGPETDAPADVARQVLRSARAILPAAVVPAAESVRGVDVLVLLDENLRPAETLQVGEPSHDAVQAERYVLDVEPGGVVVTAASVAGVVRALHTLDRLLPAAAWRRGHPTGDDDRPLEAACCHVEDAPALGWRGVLLDVSRHFLPKQEVLKHLRVLASYQVNRVQLHLADDQGWRVDVPAFPRLREVGAWRPESLRSHAEDGAGTFDGTPHGGIYSQADLREITGYAADLGIEVVPEIDLPGHTAALIAAYPEVGTAASAARARVATTWGVLDALVAPVPPALDLVESVLDGALAALPGTYLHLGGDEALIAGWLEDDAVLAHAASTGAGSVHEIFAALLDRLQAFCASRGRRMVVWDDAFAVEQRVGERAGDPAESVPDPFVVMAWRGSEVARRAAAAGHDVVLAPLVPGYLDYAASAADTEPLAIGGPVTLDDVLTWDAAPPGWSPQEQAHLLGVQAQLWTEYVPDGRAVDYLLHPRALAFAEVAWRGRVPDDDRAGALGRLAAQLPRLDAAGVEYRPLAGPHPWQQGGTGWRAHRPLSGMESVVAVHEEAARDGRVAGHDL